MNGVRRLLAVATSTSSSTPTSSDAKASPIAFNPANGPSWPPQSPITAVPQTPPQAITPVFTKDVNRQKQRHPTPPPNGDPFSSNAAYNRSTPTSPASTLPPNRIVKRKSPPQAQSLSEIDWKRITSSSISSTATSTVRDELLMSLLASQALVDSRDLEILTSEQVDELKKEYQVLASRLEALSKKLALEIKIRDAAVSLSKVNAAHKKVSKQTDEQLEAANRRVEAAQTELWRVSERLHEVNRKLMDHRAGVLSHSIGSMEQKIRANGGTSNGTIPSDDSGYDSSNRSTLMSPTVSSTTSSSTASSKARFDGLHLFAGHADTIVPRRQLSGEEALAEITALEVKLKAATGALTAAGKKQAEMTRELSVIRLEKQEVEVLMAMDLQSAEETINALEKELPRLEGLDEELRQLEQEKRIWQGERTRLEEQVAKLKDLQARSEVPGTGKLLDESRRILQEKEDEVRRITGQWHAEREVWQRQKGEAAEDRSDDLMRLQNEMDNLREQNARALQQANEEVDSGLAGLEALLKQYGIVLFSRDSSLQGLLCSLGTHLETVHAKLDAQAKAESEWEILRRKLEDDIRSGLDRREALAQDLENARRERDEARKELRNNISSHTTVYNPSESSLPESVDRILQILIPIWNILPSPEARAAKFSHSRQFRTAGPPSSPSISPLQLGSPGGPKAVINSLSELDVRSLKSLYESSRGFGSGGQLLSPAAGGDFSIEAFASRVQALIQDDRALIERLVRFAQAHDLLKKNAERAQKLAQEGTNALETYQRQVRTLEERNASMAGRLTVLQDEVQHLQEVLERFEYDKQQLETLSTQQAETCQQLTEANNTLSARTLTLAEEAASAPEMVRKQLEAKLAETRAELEAARDEVEAMCTSEQSQRAALLDELNSMQTENATLRAQLRARK